MSAAEALSTWTLMAYLRSQGGLCSAAQGYLSQFRAALGDAPARGQVRVAAQIEEPDGAAVARRLVLPQDGRETGSVTVGGDMGTAAGVADFLRWARQAAPAERYALLILAHGVPPAPDDSGPTVQAGRLGLEPLAEGLAEEKTPHFEVIFLDCCYSGSVEVADRLVGRARYLVAAPGLLYSPGLPWEAILGQLARRPEMGGRALALETSDQTRRFWEQQSEDPASLVAVDLDRVPELTQALRGLAQVTLPRVAQLAPALTLARGRAAGWGPQRELVEVGSLAAALAETAPIAVVAEQAQRVSAAAHEAAVQAWRLEPGSSDQLGAGLAVFYPLSIRAWSLRYAAAQASGLASDWARLLRAYLGTVTQLAEAGK